MRKKKVVHFCCPRAAKKGSMAFSLVEMLMALLVASLLLAALAPVMTRKITGETLNVGNNGGAVKPPAGSYCWSTTKGGGGDTIKYDTYGNRVIKYTPEPGVYYVHFALASGGGGGGGASEFKSDSAYLTGANGTSLKIEANMADFEITSLIGGGGGGGGGAAVDKSATCTGGPSATKCNCMGYQYDNINNVCVSESRGSATFDNTAAKCNSIPKDQANTGWSVPTKDQLAGWNSQYSKFGITSGTAVWSKTSGQGACTSQTPTTYNCYNNGVYKTGQSSASACCSGSSYGQSGGLTKCPNFIWSGTGNNWYWVKCSAGCYALAHSQQSYCQSLNNQNSYCQNAGGGSFVSCDFYDTVTCPSSAGGTTCSTGGNKDTCASTVTTSGGQCNAHAVNYYYSILSGTSWNNTYSTSKSGIYDVRCVYGGSGNVGTEVFYSLSGGGGGGAPAITNDNFDSNILNIFNQRIRENAGGYIVLEVGNGGSGGAKISSKGQKGNDGTNGGRTCVAITGSNKADVKYRICVPGGNGGKSGNGAIVNAETKGWGAGAAGIATNSHACYAIDYTTNSTGITTKFNCNNAGKAGANGGASTNKPTAGGKGGASVLNSTQVGGTAAVEGINASSANYGAGGGGGSSTKTGLGTSGTLTFGKGGNGAGGYAYISYKKRYDAGGGGGGGAGSVAFIKNYRVSGGGDSECTFTIGKGGTGGSIAAAGTNGGDTSVICTKSGGHTFKVYGGLGGSAGITAPNAGGNSTGGSGGTKGTQPKDLSKHYSTDILELSSDKLVSKMGYDGTSGGINDENYTNYIPVKYSAGGRGGSVLNGLFKGGCGSLLNDTVCTYNTTITPNQSELAGMSISADDLKFPDLTKAEDFGNYGRGGGGGGWHIEKGSGKGGDGLGGYACIWWDKVE